MVPNPPSPLPRLLFFFSSSSSASVGWHLVSLSSSRFVSHRRSSLFLGPTGPCSLLMYFVCIYTPVRIYTPCRYQYSAHVGFGVESVRIRSYCPPTSKPIPWNRLTGTKDRLSTLLFAYTTIYIPFSNPVCNPRTLKREKTNNKTTIENRERKKEKASSA